MCQRESKIKPYQPEKRYLQVAWQAQGVDIYNLTSEGNTNIAMGKRAEARYRSQQKSGGI